MSFLLIIVSAIIVIIYVYLLFREWKLGAAGMEDLERIQGSVVHVTARLHANTSSSTEKKLVTK